MKKVLFIVVMLFSFIGLAQDDSKKAAYRKQVSFGHLTVKEGLSQNSVVSMIQDSIGYLWFATQDGLNRYDGREFTYFNKQFQSITRPGFSKLGKLYIDKQNRFWMLSSFGTMERYNYSENTFSTIKTDYEVSAVYQDEKYNFYLGTYGSGLYIIKANTKDTIQIVPSKVAPEAYAFLESKNNIYVATSKGVIEIRPDESYQNMASDIPSDIQVSSLTQSKETLWVGTFGDGLYYKAINESVIKKFKGLKEQLLPEKLNIEDILIDHSGKLWIATYGEGVFLIDFLNEKLSHFEAQKNNPFSIHYKDVLCLLQDNTGNVWLGTDGAGASFYDEHLVKFNLLINNQLPSGINVDVVRSIATDATNNLWLGTSGLGLTKIDMAGSNHKTFMTSNSNLNSNRVVSLYFNEETLWIGHQDSGLNTLNGEGLFIEHPETAQMTIWSILPINSKKAWLATEKNGLILFDRTNGIEKRFNKDNSNLKSTNIRTIVKGDINTLWIGSSEDGLYKLNLKNEEILKIQEVSDDIKSLWWNEDHLWIGTNGNGLKQLHWPSNKITTFTQKEGLRNEVIYGVIPDNSNLLWISTNLGISSLKMKTNGGVVIENYTDANGLQGLEFNTGAYHKDKNGVIYFGGLEGVNWFMPEQITVNKVLPQTVITKIELFGEEIKATAKTSFASNENTLTFNFSSLHFSQPNQNQYQYQLVNNDENWIDAGNKNIAHYTNLPPNDYKFQVISSNYDGVWNKTPAQYNFTIKKPWYATNFAITLYTFFVGLFIYLTYAYLKWRWKLNTQLQLEQAETERLQKLDDFKTKLYTNLSHEFKTPLTLIKGLSRKVLSKTTLSEIQKESIHSINENGEQLLTLVNQMLELVSIDSNQLSDNYKRGNVVVFIKNCTSLFSSFATSKQQQLQFKSSIKSLVMDVDDDKLQKIINNLLSNAIKFTPKGGNIEIRLLKEDDATLKIEVEDSGKGIKPADIPHVFDRYYKTFDLDNNIGSGIGMELSKELVEFMGGTITVESNVKKGTTFTVHLPIKNTIKEAIKFEYSKPFITSKTENKPIPSNNLLEDKPMLLIVEDNVQICNYFRDIFQYKYQLIVANNGRKALEIAENKNIDFIISDVLMPIMNGFEFCEKIKNNPKTSHLPFILVTAKTDKESRLKGYKLGVDAYVDKPFSENELLQIMENLLEKRNAKMEFYKEILDIKNTNLKTKNVHQLDLEFIKKVQEFALDKKQHKTMKDFAKELLMSRTQLHRKIKQLTNMSITQYVNHIKLEKGKQMLTHSTLTVSEIAYELGFDDPKYFSKLFKKEQGKTPSAFRETP